MDEMLNSLMSNPTPTQPPPPKQTNFNNVLENDDLIQWSGFITRKNDKATRVNVDAYLINGEIDFGTLYNLNISSKKQIIEVEELYGRCKSAVIGFKPANETCLSQFDEHYQYLTSRMCAGVMAVANYTIYVMTPQSFTDKYFTGARTYLVGLAFSNEDLI